MLLAALPSPSGSETPTLDELADDYAEELADDPDFLDELGIPAEATEPPLSTVAAWLESLLSEGAMPSRSQLIELLRDLLRAHATPAFAMLNGAAAACLLQDNVPGDHFPHLVDTKQGRLLPERALWQQYKTKMTHIEMLLVNGQGEPINGSTLQDGGLELELTLRNATTGETLCNEHNPKRGEGLFTGVGRGAFEPYAAARAQPF